MGFIAKPGQFYNCNLGAVDFALPAYEGDIIGISLKEGEDDNYAVEVFKNRKSLGILCQLPKKDYFFFIGLSENTEYEVSDCYPHYIK